MATKDFTELAAQAVSSPMTVSGHESRWFVTEAWWEGEISAGPFLVSRKDGLTLEASMEQFRREFNAACRALDVVDPESEWDAEQPIALLQNSGWVICPVAHVEVSVNPEFYAADIEPVDMDNFERAVGEVPVGDPQEA